MKKKLPQFMMIYQCDHCGLDSGYTELDKYVSCRYCESNGKMKLISKEIITEEVMINRLKKVSQSMFENLKAAFEMMTDEDKELLSEDGKDGETELLKMMQSAKEIKDQIHHGL